MKFDAALVIKQANMIAMKKAESVVKQTLVNVAEELCHLSPVGQPEDWASSPPKDYEPGNYKANWQYSFETPKTDYLEEALDDSVLVGAGSDTHNRLKKEIKANTKMLGTHYFSNNTPYAEKMEYGYAIHNPQAQTKPHAVAGLTVQHIPLALERAKKQVLGR